MELWDVALVVVAAALAAELVAQLRWTTAYYRAGIPIYRRTTAVVVRTAFELYFDADEATWPGWRRLAFRRLSQSEALFRERMLWPGIGVCIHGRILEGQDGRQEVFVYAGFWPLLALVMGTALSLADGSMTGAVSCAAMGVALVLVQRARARRIARTIEDIQG